MADVSGAWLGTYWYQGVPTRFEATLVQSGNTLTGNVLDDGNLGEAQLTGTVSGRSIDFAKHYVTSLPYAVQYTGTISEDADFMSGQWRIDSRHSGNWEAQRSGTDLMAELQNRLEAPLEVPTPVPAEAPLAIAPNRDADRVEPLYCLWRGSGGG